LCIFSVYNRMTKKYAKRTTWICKLQLMYWCYFYVFMTGIMFWVTSCQEMANHGMVLLSFYQPKCWNNYYGDCFSLQTLVSVLLIWFYIVFFTAVFIGCAFRFVSIHLCFKFYWTLYNIILNLILFWKLTIFLQHLKLCSLA